LVVAGHHLDARRLPGRAATAITAPKGGGGKNEKAESSNQFVDMAGPGDTMRRPSAMQETRQAWGRGKLLKMFDISYLRL
jgi:hypothetical protein